MLSRPRLPDRIFARAPPEFLLAAACCRWPSGDARLAAIRRAASGPIDWQEFLGIVDTHRVWGLAYDGLMAAAVEVPPDIARGIASPASDIAHHNLVLAAEAVRLQRLFDEARIRAVFLKGIALAMLAYGTLALKHGNDIDILVSAGEFEAACGVLERAGYALQRPPPGLSAAQLRAIVRYSADFTFVHRHTDHVVELHWRLSKNPYLLKAAGQLSPHAVVLTEKAAIATLQEPDLFAYLCAHGASHGWCRLKWLADLAALLSTRADQIEQLYRSARDAGAGHCAGQALVLCERLLAVDVPRPLVSELRRSARLEFLEAVALQAMLGGYAPVTPHQRPPATTLVSFLFLGENRRYLFEEARRLLFRFDDVVEIPLPAWLQFLYPLLRLPWWVWRRARAAWTAGTREN